MSPHFLTRRVSRLLGLALVSWAFARVGVHRLSLRTALLTSFMGCDHNKVLPTSVHTRMFALKVYTYSTQKDLRECWSTWQLSYVKTSITNLFLGLGFVDKLFANFDARLEECLRHLKHWQSQQMARLLSNFKQNHTVFLPVQHTSNYDTTKVLMANNVHSFIPDISIAPLQVHYYLEVLPTTALILCRS